MLGNDAARTSGAGEFCRRFLPWLAPVVALLAVVTFGRGPIPPSASAATGPGPKSPEAGFAVTSAAEPMPAAIERSAIDAGGDRRDGAVEAEGHPAIEYLGDGGIIVDLNAADEQQLRRLPGIGAGRAKAIVELRARLGRFRSVDDLARIKGLGRSLLRKIRPRARV